MIKRRHTKHYERKMRSNKVEYSTASGVYCTTHDVKVPFCMLELSSRKTINHPFNVDNDKGSSGIGYDIIIGRDLMVQLCIMADFKSQFLPWDEATLHMKDRINVLGKYDLTNREMRGVVMQAAEPTSTQESN